jgi:hypothetical protein
LLQLLGLMHINLRIMNIQRLTNKELHFKLFHEYTESC